MAALKGLYQPKGRQVWMLRYSRHGRQIRESLETRDYVEAVRKATEILNSATLLQAGDYEAEIEEYIKEQRKIDELSIKAANIRGNMLPKFFHQMGKSMVAQVTTADIQRFYGSYDERVKDEKLQEETRQSYVRWIGAFYDWLVEKNRIRSNPYHDVKMVRLRQKARKRTVPKDEVAKLLDQCTDRGLKYAIFCGFHAGMRKEEVIESRPEWFDLNTWHIHIDTTPTWTPKDRDRRSIPISKQFREFLKEYGLPSPYMLKPDVAPRSVKRKGGWVTYRYDFKRPFQNLLKKCGVQCSFHDARRTFASHLVSAGVPIYKVAKWLGDGIKVAEKHYGHLQPDNDDIEKGFA